MCSGIQLDETYIKVWESQNRDKKNIKIKGMGMGDFKPEIKMI